MCQNQTPISHASFKGQQCLDITRETKQISIYIYVQKNKCSYTYIYIGLKGCRNLKLIRAAWDPKCLCVFIMMKLKKLLHTQLSNLIMSFEGTRLILLRYSLILGVCTDNICIPHVF